MAKSKLYKAHYTKQTEQSEFGLSILHKANCIKQEENFIKQIVQSKLHSKKCTNNYTSAKL